MLILLQCSCPLRLVLFEALGVGLDQSSELAVLKIEPSSQLLEIQFGDSSNLMIGEWAVAIGHPFASAVGNPKPTVTIGVVSATNRTLKTENGCDICMSPECGYSRCDK